MQRENRPIIRFEKQVIAGSNRHDETRRHSADIHGSPAFRK